MRAIKSYDALDRFGRIRLSKHFFMRDFMYSEISNFYGIPNIPENPDRAVEAGKRLCDELLEPLNATFGRITVRSAYRSSEINQIGNYKRHNCASNKANLTHHIWDYPDEHGLGATACIAIPWFIDKYNNCADWRSLAYWIHDYHPYSEMEFFDGEGMCSFNLSWHENSRKNITSWLSTRVLLIGGSATAPFSEWYEGFPKLNTSL